MLWRRRVGPLLVARRGRRASRRPRGEFSSAPPLDSTTTSFRAHFAPSGPRDSFFHSTASSARGAPPLPRLCAMVWGARRSNAAARMRRASTSTLRANKRARASGALSWCAQLDQNCGSSNTTLVFVTSAGLYTVPSSIPNTPTQLRLRTFPSALTSVRRVAVRAPERKHVEEDRRRQRAPRARFEQPRHRASAARARRRSASAFAERA